MNALSRRAPFLGWVLGAYVLWALFIAALEIAEIGVVDLFRDPTQLDEFLADHPWKSSFSMVGNLAWAAASSMSLLTGAVLRARDEPGYGFFLAMGAVFLAMGFDDAFTIHDNFAGVVLGSASELAVLSILALLFVAWVVVYRREILETSYVLLILGAVGLGIPFLIDAREVLDIEASWLGIAEEAGELAGILTLLLYVSIETWRALVRLGRGGSAFG